MKKRKYCLNLYQGLFILVTSWLYTLLTFYIPFEMNTHSLCDIYTFQGVPFGVALGIVLNYYYKHRRNL